MATLMLVAIFAVIKDGARWTHAGLPLASHSTDVLGDHGHLGTGQRKSKKQAAESCAVLETYHEPPPARPRMRADALRDNTAWRALVAGVVRRGIELGTFGDRYDPDTVAMLAVAAADGMGIPLSLGDPEITARGAVHDVLAAMRELLSPDGSGG